MLNTIRQQTRQALSALLAAAKLSPGDMLVLGASSSEILGQTIGSASSLEIAQAAVDEILSVAREQNIALAVQCCEHLNRCLVIEEETARRYGYEPVNVVPQPKAGGAFATAAYSLFRQPVVVEHIRAKAGMDIGQTLIGMHMAEVCVPVRCGVTHIGQAVLTCCRTRPKFVGGERAHYDQRLK